MLQEHFKHFSQLYFQLQDGHAFHIATCVVTHLKFFSKAFLKAISPNVQKIFHPWLPRVQGSPMKLRLNAHAQYECMDLRAETKSKKCASDKNSRTVHVYTGLDLTVGFPGVTGYLAPQEI